MATCDPNTLLAEGACLDCLDDHQLQIVIAQLLCNGGGGGSFKQQFFFNAGDPNGVVNVPHDLPATVYDTVNNVEWAREGGAPGDTGWI